MGDGCEMRYYCDGAGGLRTWTWSYGHGDDPSCRGGCDQCSAAQVVGAMAAAPDSYNVQRNGCHVLGELAQNSETNRAAISSAGGIELVTAAMSRFPNSYDVQDYGCHALARLAHNSETNRAAIGSAGGIEVVAAAMSRFPDDSYMQEYGCWALAWLAEDSETNGAAIGSAGGIELAKAAMSRFPDDSDVQETCKAVIERVPQPSAWLRWRDVCKVLLPFLCALLCLGMAVGRCIYTHRSRQRTNMAGIRSCCACRCITAVLPTSEPQEGLSGTKLVEMLRQTTVWISNPLSSPLALGDPSSSSSDPEVLSASSSESLAVDDDDATLCGCGSDDANAVRKRHF